MIPVGTKEMWATAVGVRNGGLETSVATGLIGESTFTAGWRGKSNTQLTPSLVSEMRLWPHQFAEGRQTAIVAGKKLHRFSLGFKSSFAVLPLAFDSGDAYRSVHTQRSPFCDQMSTTK